MPYNKRADGRGYSLYPALAKDPKPVPRSVKVYAKLVAGVARLFVQGGDSGAVAVLPSKVAAVYGEVLGADVATPLSGAFVSLLAPPAVTVQAGSRLSINFSASGTSASGNNQLTRFRLLIDGALAIACGEPFRNVQPACTSLAFLSGPLTGGAHTVEIEWSGSAANQSEIRPLTDPNGEHASIVISEILQ